MPAAIERKKQLLLSSASEGEDNQNDNLKIVDI
jgi:hypothetical protein